MTGRILVSGLVVHFSHGVICFYQFVPFDCVDFKLRLLDELLHPNPFLLCSGWGSLTYYIEVLVGDLIFRSGDNLSGDVSIIPYNSAESNS